MPASVIKFKDEDQCEGELLSLLVPRKQLTNQHFKHTGSCRDFFFSQFSNYYCFLVTGLKRENVPQPHGAVGLRSMNDFNQQHFASAAAGWRR